MAGHQDYYDRTKNGIDNAPISSTTSISYVQIFLSSLDACVFVAVSANVVSGKRGQETLVRVINI